MTQLLVVCLMLAAICSGCRSCDNPYDYCSPVIDSGYNGAAPTSTGPWMESEVEEVPTPAAAAPTPARGHSVMVPKRLPR